MIKPFPGGADFIRIFAATLGYSLFQSGDGLCNCLRIPQINEADMGLLFRLQDKCKKTGRKPRCFSIPCVEIIDIYTSEFYERGSGWQSPG